MANVGGEAHELVAVAVSRGMANVRSGNGRKQKMAYHKSFSSAAHLVTPSGRAHSALRDTSRCLSLGRRWRSTLVCAGKWAGEGGVQLRAAQERRGDGIPNLSRDTRRFRERSRTSSSWKSANDGTSIGRGHHCGERANVSHRACPPVGHTVRVPRRALPA